MIIVNDLENIVVFSNKLRSVNIHTDKKKIMANYEALLPPVVIGMYKNPEKCDRAFGMLLRALEENEQYFRIPKDEEVMVNVVRGAGYKKIRTTGKTK